jgi:hypothetical protein
MCGMASPVCGVKLHKNRSGVIGQHMCVAQLLRRVVWVFRQYDWCPFFIAPDYPCYFLKDMPGIDAGIRKEGGTQVDLTGINGTPSCNGM